MINKNISTQVSSEAIEVRANPELFDRLTALIRALRTDIPVLGKTIQKDIAVAIESVTNIKTNINVDIKDYLDAYVYYPKIDVNSPLVAAWGASGRFNNKEMLTNDGLALLQKKSKKTAWVDRSTSKVHGAFTEIVTNIHVSSHLLATLVLTPEEAASTIVHEVGHIFTYYETLGTTIASNYAMMSIVDAYTKAPDVPRRIVLLKNAASAVEFNGLDIEVAANAKSTRELAFILIDANVKTIRSQTGLSVYDENGFEFLSDQFATRHGCGRHLVTALDKMHRGHDTDYMGSTSRFFMHVAEVCLIVFLGAATLVIPAIAFIPVLLIYGSFAISPFGGSYDRIGDRFQRIRNDMVHALKSKGITVVKQKTIIADIEEIDKITAEIKPYFSLLDWLAISLRSKFRQQRDQKQLEQELEKLATNDLFIKAAQFTHLK